MRGTLKLLLLSAFLVLCAFFSSHGAASAANCTMQTASLGSDLIAGYDVFAASESYTITTPLQFKCPNYNGISACQSAGSCTVNIFFLGSAGTAGSYSDPFLNGPGSSQLKFAVCKPGVTTSNCTSTTGPNVWTATSGITINSVPTNTPTSVTGSIAVFVPQQDVFTGISSQYAGTVNFAFTCGPPPAGPFTAC